MKNQKNQATSWSSLCEMSAEQKNPYLAAPEDFEIIRDDDEVFHGQRSDRLQKHADRESNRKPGKRSPATEPGDASAPRTTGIGSDE